MEIVDWLLRYIYGFLWVVWFFVLGFLAFLDAAKHYILPALGFYVLYRAYRWRKSYYLIPLMVLAPVCIWLTFTWDRYLSAYMAQGYCNKGHSIEFGETLKYETREVEPYKPRVRREPITFHKFDQRYQGRYDQVRDREVLFYKVTKITQSVVDTEDSHKVLVKVVTFKPYEGWYWYGRGKHPTYCDGQKQSLVDKNGMLYDGREIHISELVDIADVMRW